MVTRYRRNGALYSFILNEAETGDAWKPFITLVKTPNDEHEPETIVNIPVKDSNSYRVKINKKSISAANGARGLFCFIRDCIRNDFMTAYVNQIINVFNK